MNKEKKEALLRIPIGIVVYIIIYFWGALTSLLILFNFFYVLFTGKRNKDVTNFVNIYVSYFYKSVRYVSFTTNERPFPFAELGKPLDKPDFKTQN